MSLQGIASTMSHINSVNYIQYSVAPDSSVSVTINRTLYAGKYANISDAATMVKGLLTKCGVWDVDSRLLSIPQEIIGSGTVAISPAVDFVSFVTENDSVTPAISYGSTQKQILGITRPVILKLTSNDLTNWLYVKTLSSTSPVSPSVDPSNDGYTQVVGTDAYLIVQPSYYIRFKCSSRNLAAGPSGPTSTITVVNASNSFAAVDTFTIQTTYI